MGDHGGKLDIGFRIFVTINKKIENKYIVRLQLQLFRSGAVGEGGAYVNIV